MKERKKEKQTLVLQKHSADHVRNTSSKTIFHDSVLYAQFLRDNVNVPVLKNVRPEDIEDVSEKYRPYLGIEWEADTVKRIRLRDSAGTEMNELLYLISLTEHKSDVDYDVAMQLLKYMVCIWIEYGKEKEKMREGSTSSKSFRYPPILPIVYYEGKAEWTADMRLRDRIIMNEIFRGSIPDFSYEVVRIHDYSNEELLERNDEMSLIMLFNKIQDEVDLDEFVKLPTEKVNKIVQDTPEYIIEIIATVMQGLCTKIGATEEETRQCIQKVKERQMGYLFENMEKMNIQEERKNTAEARREALVARMEATQARAEAEREKANAEKEKANAEREKANAEKEKANAEREKANAEKEKANAQREKANAEKEKANAQREKANAEQAKAALEEYQKQSLENIFKTLINTYRKLGGTQEAVMQSLKEEYHLTQEEAEQKVSLYWE